MASKSYFQNNKVYNCFGKKKNSHKTFFGNIFSPNDCNQQLKD